jgi:subtilisin family serine protease
MVAQQGGDDTEGTERERFPAGPVAPTPPLAIVVRVQPDLAEELWRSRPQLETMGDGEGQLFQKSLLPVVQLFGLLVNFGARTIEWPLLSAPQLLDGLTDEEIKERRAIVQVGFAPASNTLQALSVAQQAQVVREANAVVGDAPPFFPADDLLGANDQDLTRQWYLYRMRVDRAWRYNTGAGVAIADIDYGYFTAHEDLIGNLDLEKAFNSHDMSNVVDYGPSITHGTAVMGLAGAAANGVGMVGVAPAARLWPIQANSGPGPRVKGNKWARGIDFVRSTASTLRKVAILENQTSPAGGCYEQMLDVRVAIEQALAHGVVVVTAAGNGNREVSNDDHGTPYPDSGSILVGATAFHERHNPRACFSNYGARIAVSAPGYGPSDLTCKTDLLNKYRAGFGGTSGAASKVAGVCALMLSGNPSLTPWDVKQLLVQTGSEVLTSPNRPAGVFVNAKKAVKRAIKA